MSFKLQSVDKHQEAKRARLCPSGACEFDQAGRYRVFPKKAGFTQTLFN